MKKAIVTGANGFVGHAVVEELCRHGIQVTALVHSVQHRKYNNDLVRVIPFDLENIVQAKESILDDDYDVFYHFAWNGGHGTDRFDTMKQLQNVQWSVECVRLAKELNCLKFVGVGTIMEFESYMVANEQESRPGRGYIYGSAKLAAHMMMKSVAAELNIDFIWGMLINAFGPGENSPRLINRTIRSVLAADKPLEFTTGKQNYDFVYIDDAARAFYLMGESGVPYKGYMIGSGEAKPLLGFLEEIKEELHPSVTFEYGAVPYTGINLPLNVFAIDELCKDTGYQPEVSFSDGICRTADWIRHLSDNK